MATRPRKTPSKPRAFPHPHHDHSRCAADALRTAEAVCEKHGARLTEIRRRVLDAVWASHAPIGAYDILAELNTDGGKIAPMAVYRALDFLMEHGLVHRLASLNAFIGCALASERHTAHFLICRSCKSATEMDGTAVTRAVKKTLSEHGFVPETEIVEIQGLCAHCHKEST
ncbi:MAG: Fur family transcriptional regulator [Rhodospirillaceae bacterium]